MKKWIFTLSVTLTSLMSQPIWAHGPVYSVLALQVSNAESLAAFKLQRQQQLDAFQLKKMQEFIAFKAKRNTELAAFRTKLLEQWGEVEVSDKTKIVNYPEPQIKTVVDFENQNIVVSVLHTENEPLQRNKILSALSKLTEINTSTDGSQPRPIDILKFYAANDTFDDIETLVDSAEVVIETPTIDDQDLAQEAAIFAQQQQLERQQIDIMADALQVEPINLELLHNAIDTQTRTASVIARNQINNAQKQSSNTLRTKRITRLTINIRPKSFTQRINEIKPLAMKYAHTWDISLPLIVAVIHTESSFNPLAVSQIPAYGLMQIVPISAGVDVNQLLYKKREPLDKDYLFVANQNIEAGTAYLHLLSNRYLAKITDPNTRLLCTIAAYNTGVGNVARAFSKGKSHRLDDNTLSLINAMAAEQAYQQLLNNLPYDETRKYLKKVTTLMREYQNI
jgi:membrane-bound lytic murein transglycosylase C